MVVKWDLELDRAMTGEATRRVRRILDELRRKGCL